MTVGNRPDYSGMKTNSIELTTCFRLCCKKVLMIHFEQDPLPNGD